MQHLTAMNKIRKSLTCIIKVVALVSLNTQVMANTGANLQPDILLIMPDQWRAQLIKRLQKRPEGFVKEGKLIAGRPYRALNEGTPSQKQ